MNPTSVLVSSVSYLLAVTLLLGISGIAGPSLLTLQAPSACVQTSCPANQSFVTAVSECAFDIVTLGIFGFDCNEKTVTKTFATISDVLGFALSYTFFFFQLLTFQLPIPAALNAAIIMPAATGLAYVGLRYIRGGG